MVASDLTQIRLYLAAGNSPLISPASVSFDADCCYELHHAPEFHTVR